MNMVLFTMPWKCLRLPEAAVTGPLGTIVLVGLAWRLHSSEVHKPVVAGNGGLGGSVAEAPGASRAA